MMKMQRRRVTLMVHFSELGLVGRASVARSKKATFRDPGTRGGVSVFRFYGPHFSHSNVWTVPIFGFHVLRIRRPAGRPAEGLTFVSCEKFSKIPEIFGNFAFVSR